MTEKTEKQYTDKTSKNSPRERERLRVEEREGPKHKSPFGAVCSSSSVGRSKMRAM